MDAAGALLRMNAQAEDADRLPRCIPAPANPLVLIAGNRESLAVFIECHGGYLRSIVGSLVSWNSDTDDLVQEVLLRAWDKGASFRGEAEFKSWLRQIAINVCRNYQRSFHRYWRKVTAAWEAKSYAAEQKNSSHDNDDRWHVVQQAMKQLSYSDRELLTLIYLEELPAEQAAHALICSVNTLHVRLHRARSRLTALLQTANHDQPE